MPSIHLIEKRGTPQGISVVDRSSHVWDSGFWKVTPDTAQKLIGGSIFLHEAWAVPSHFGGTISSFSVVDDPTKSIHGRLVFRFAARMDHKGVKAPAGANGEKRIFL